MRGGDDLSDERKLWFNGIKVGDLVDAVKIEFKAKIMTWQEAKIIEKNEEDVKVQFIGDHERFDRYI